MPRSMCTDADVGYGLIARWMAAREVVTAPYGRWPPWRRPPALPGSLAVHRVVQHRHLGEDAFYTAENLYVDPNRGIRTVKHPTGGPVLAFERGAMRLGCRRTRAWRAAPAPLTLASIRRGITFGPVPRGAPRSEEATLFVARDGATNVFHAMADVLNAYLMRRMAPYRRLVLLDEHPEGPLWPLWVRLADAPPLRWRDLGTPVVLAHAAFSPPGGCSFLWKNVHRADPACRVPSTLLAEFRQWVLDTMGVAPATGGRRRVTIVQRGSTAQPAVTRRLANPGALVAAIARVDPTAEIQTTDFATLPLREQIRASAESDVLVGVHGAGLTHVLWMRPGATLVEIIPPATERACFGNLATWVGVGYASWQDESPTAEDRRTAVHTPSLRIDVAAVAALVTGTFASSRP